MSDTLLLVDACSLQRIARVLLEQVKRGGPSNFEQVTRDYLEPSDEEVFRRLVIGERDLPGLGRP